MLNANDVCRFVEAIIGLIGEGCDRFSGSICNVSVAFAASIGRTSVAPVCELISTVDGDALSEAVMPALLSVVFWLTASRSAVAIAAALSLATVT